MTVVALVALAMQLGLSFGHIHLDDDCAARAHGLHTGLRTLNGDVGGAVHHDPHTCSICLTLAILAASVEPAPPALPPRELLPVAQADEPLAVRAIGRARLGFAARAPPPLLNS